MVKKSRSREAFELWKRFSKEKEVLFGNFRRVKGSPFHWRLTESAEGAATINGRQLQLEHFGRVEIALASKLLILPAGSYQVSFQVDSATSGASGIHWILTCLPAGRVLAEAPLNTRAGVGSFQFQVQPDCEAERLELKGLSQMYPAEVAASLSSLRLRKL
jgi:hypothetical protein